MTLSHVTNNRNPGEVVCSLVSKGFGDGNITFENFVQKKLSYLLREINSEWPKPCQGFIEFYQTIKKLSGIKVAILSSGHTSFIQKTFSVWGLNLPQIMLTYDDFPGYYFPGSSTLLKLLSKPSSFLVDLIKWKWGGQRQHIAIFGDDPKKDGELARNAGVPFGLFSRQNYESIENSFQFSDWAEISNFLKEKTSQKLISRGVPFAEIIFCRNKH